MSSHPLGYKLPLALRALGACAHLSALCGGRCGHRRLCSVGPSAHTQVRCAVAGAAIAACVV
eukprot:5498699-Pleurochrysis_carterae.AAC.1